MYRPPEVCKQAVYSNGGSWWMQGGPPSLPKVVGVFHCGGSMEESQDQIMVCFLAGFLDRRWYILHSHKVVCPVPHLPDSTYHAPRPPVSRTCILLWEEMSSHVLHPFGGKVRRDLFVPHNIFLLVSSALKLPTTSSAAPQGRWLMAMRTLSMFNTSSRAM